MLTHELARERYLVVAGDPIPKGSLRCVGRNGRHQVIEDNPRTHDWLELVAERASELELTLDPDQAVGVELTCTISRPLSHHRTGRNAHLLRDNAPRRPVRARTGDVDKLARLVLDALQAAGVLADDAQVVELTVRKEYVGKGGFEDAAQVPGIVVRLYPLEESP